MSYTHVRFAKPRYEVTVADAVVPCCNTEHAAAVLSNLGGPRLTEDRIYNMVRSDSCTAPPTGMAVRKLTAAERATRPAFRVTRTVELAAGPAPKVSEGILG